MAQWPLGISKYQVTHAVITQSIDELLPLESEE
jgi:hypothetical protein